MSAPVELTFAQILRAVATQAGVSLGEILAPAAATNAVENRPRQRAIFIALRLKPEMSLGFVGRQLGGRHQTTVRGSYEAGERRYRLDAAEEAAVWQVLEALGVPHLPAFDPLARKRLRIEREIRAAADRLERLQARRAELRTQEEAH